MGISPFKKSCFNLSNKRGEYEVSFKPSSAKAVDDINPNPFVFVIKKFKDVGSLTAALINYPNCSNYEGNKVILLEGINGKSLKKLKYLDPHFSKSFPILARFEPTERGWNLALLLAKNITDNGRI